MSSRFLACPPILSGVYSFSLACPRCRQCRRVWRGRAWYPGLNRELSLVDMDVNMTFHTEQSERVRIGRLTRITVNNRKRIITGIFRQIIRTLTPQCSLLFVPRHPPGESVGFIHIQQNHSNVPQKATMAHTVSLELVKKCSFALGECPSSAIFDRVGSYCE